MWSSLFDQIQQRIDDAVDLLGDEEAEETAGRAESSSAVATTSTAAPDNVALAPLSVPRRLAACSSVSDAGADVGDAWGDDDDLKNLGTPAQALQPAPRELAPHSSPVATVSVCDESEGGSTPVAKRADDQQAIVVQPAAVVQAETPPETESPPLLAAPAAQSDESHPPSPPEEEPPSQEVTPDIVALEPSASLRSVVAAHEVMPPSPPPPEELEEAPTAASKAFVMPGAVSLPPSSPSLASSSSTVTPALPSPSPPATESQDVKQLLRFQRQLAEEMESAAQLQAENGALRSRVSALETELTAATAALAQTADVERQVSVLIEKLGKEKERHKAAAALSSELEEQVQDLEEELEDFRIREEKWLSGQEQHHANEKAAQQRIDHLESEALSRDTLVENLSAQLREARHQVGVLTNQVGELKVCHATQLDSVKESSSDVVEQVRREAEQLRNSLQQLSSEYDTRTAELERQVQQSNMRAHQAEARLSEMEFGSVNTLHDLRSELEDAQRSSATWKAEAQKTRNEYTELLDQYASLKRARAAAESDLRDRLGVESAAVAALRKASREWEERYQALQDSARSAQAEAEEQRRTIMQLESTVLKLKASSVEALSRAPSEPSIAGVTAAAKPTPSLEASLSGTGSSGRPTGRAMSALPLNPFANMERPAWGDAADRRTRERLEQEVVRQSAEVERLRTVAAEVAGWKTRHARLQEEHDLLLQLFGQVEEELRSLKGATAADARSSAVATLANAI